MECVTVITDPSSASTISHANGKSKNRYFRILKKGSYVFFDANS